MFPPISSSEKSLVTNHNFFIQFEAHLTNTSLILFIMKEKNL